MSKPKLKLTPLNKHNRKLVKLAYERHLDRLNNDQSYQSKIEDRLTISKLAALADFAGENNIYEN
jgi:hypothetical protein